MVFFTCNHCGSSLKKNKVDKHYAIECRANPSLSCMDCMKDFYGEEYKGHTKCMTENQKYSGKPLSASELGKGEKKQLIWVETVRKIVETKGSSLTLQERQLFESMKNFENIPRKKKKFENFLKNVMKRYIEQRTIDKVWSLLEEHKPMAGDCKGADNVAKELGEVVHNEGQLVEEKSKKKGISKISEENVEGKVEQNNGLNEIHDDKDNFSTEQNEMSRKKRKKERKEEDNDCGSENVVEKAICQKETVKKEKKKHKKTDTEKSAVTTLKNTEEEELVMELGDECIKEESLKLSKKERKERRKREKYEMQLKSIESNKSQDVMDADLCDAFVGGERQKKNKKAKNKERIENGTEVDVGDNGGTKKEKDGRKRKHEADVKMDTDAEKKLKVESDGNMLMEGIESNYLGEKGDGHDKPKGKFKWDKTILSILRSVPDSELPVKRLRKKVLAEYQQSLVVRGTNGNSLAEALGMFERKLHKVPGVKILKDRAKIVACSE